MVLVVEVGEENALENGEITGTEPVKEYFWKISVPVDVAVADLFGILMRLVNGGVLTLIEEEGVVDGLPKVPTGLGSDGIGFCFVMG